MVLQELFSVIGFKVDKPSLSNAEAAVEKVKHGLTRLGEAFAAFELVKKLKEIVEETAGAATGAAKAAQRIGVARESFEELAHAAHESGVPIEAMETGLKFLNRNLYAAGKGSGEAGQSFRALGIATRDGTGKLRSADDVMMDAAERFAGMKDGAEKTALSMRLFGRSGNELIPMLNKGREGLAEMRQEAHELGLVFSEEDVAAAKDFTVSSRRLDSVLEGVKRRIGIALLPQLGKMKKEFADWIIANRELIKQRVVEFAEGLGKALRAVVQVTEPLRAMIASLIDLVASSSEAKTAITVLGGALLLMFNAPLASAMALFGIIEEIWGWITGKRDTLLGDWLGPFQQLDKLNPADSDFTKGIKSLFIYIKENGPGVKDTLVTIANALRAIWDVTGKPITWLFQETAKQAQNMALPGPAGALVNVVAAGLAGTGTGRAAGIGVTPDSTPAAGSAWLGTSSAGAFVNLLAAVRDSMRTPSFQPLGGSGIGSMGGVSVTVNVDAGGTVGAADGSRLGQQIGEQVRIEIQKVVSNAHVSVNR